MENCEGVKDPKISRRTFLKVIAVSPFALSGARNESSYTRYTSLIEAKQTPEINRQEEAERKLSLSVSEQGENYERSITRESSFKPFERGFMWWQYLQFQYVDQESGHRYGVTISFSELKNLSRMGGIIENDNQNKQDELVHSFLVMRHNLDTGETVAKNYRGSLSFDEEDMQYLFVDGASSNAIGKLAYRKEHEDYVLHVDTEEFRSIEIDHTGDLYLRPQGDLILVSKDGSFTVASFEGGKLETEYYADHICVYKGDGSIVGYGRRDSENLMLMGTPSRESGVDIDHRWVHVSGKLENEDLFFATVWGCQTGGNYKFVEIRVINSETKEISNYSYNEEDSDRLEVEFNIDHKEVEEAGSRDQLIDDKALIQHGGLVVAKLGDLEIVRLVIDSNPGQVLNVKGFRMTESHGRIVVDDSRILGRRVIKSNSAIYESTTEILGVHLPLVVK